MTNVIDNKEEQRFELEVDGHTAFAAYDKDGDIVVFTHTVAPTELRGQGVGSRLVEGALSQVRAAGGRVRPLCTFVAGYIAQHPQWGDLRA
ncbi:GNAT family N-acetyltransferase [Sphingomonas sp. S2-65]|uniref:GNAT family N-acetyltransferase n=1 Tax=Sphingomonas sp. S2-65 TaxID=2903960 RepID=UPI001F373E0D|nr:GNAT family N-acetyltransferase [Sphingomonas sp. S2-65]UYY57353.1 N-acetyltransferase [Sphingomonas sp. S2-65]